MRKQIEWDAVADKAKRMSASELHYAILDCIKASKAADQLDRAGFLGHNAKDGGYYSDEASIYRTEQARRQGVK